MEMDRDSYELSWAHVHELECERCSTPANLPDVAYIHQTRNLESHTLQFTYCAQD